MFGVTGAADQDGDAIVAAAVAAGTGGWVAVGAGVAVFVAVGAGVAVGADVFVGTSVLVSA